MSIAAKAFAKHDYFELMTFELDEKVIEIKEPWTIWDYEVIGETADYFVMWRWNGDDGTYAPGLMKKSDMPQQMADYDESMRMFEKMKRTHEQPPAVEAEREGVFAKIRKLFRGQ